MAMDDDTGSTDAAQGPTVDAEEIAKFAAMAAEWWDPAGKFAPLHRFNPVRLQFIRDTICAHFGRDPKALRPFDGLSLLDIGCGGGLLSEPMARLGAQATGIDASATNIGVARAHAGEQDLAIDYRHTTAEDLAETGARFDVVLNMEVVEHVASVPLFLEAAGALVAPGGLMILATLNRTAKAFALAVVGAEYVLGWLPRGTHRHSKFVRPAEIRDALRPHGFKVNPPQGVSYRPLSGSWRLSSDVAVNYMIVAEKGAS